MPENQKPDEEQSQSKRKVRKLSSTRVIASFGQSVENQPWSNPLIFSILIGVLAVIVFGWKRENSLSATAIAVLIAGCALAVGAILGFLFGIPRTIQETGPREKI